MLAPPACSTCVFTQSKLIRRPTYTVHSTAPSGLTLLLSSHTHVLTAAASHPTTPAHSRTAPLLTAHPHTAAHSPSPHCCPLPILTLLPLIWLTRDPLMQTLGTCLSPPLPDEGVSKLTEHCEKTQVPPPPLLQPSMPVYVAVVSALPPLCMCICCCLRATLLLPHL